MNAELSLGSICSYRSAILVRQLCVLCNGPPCHSMVDRTHGLALAAEQQRALFFDKTKIKCCLPRSILGRVGDQGEDLVADLGSEIGPRQDVTVLYLLRSAFGGISDRSQVVTRQEGRQSEILTSESRKVPGSSSPLTPRC